MLSKVREFKELDFDEALESLQTIRDYIRWAVSLFNSANLSFGHGSDNPWDEATHLVFCAVHLPVDTQDDFVLDACLTPGERSAVIKLVKERILTQKPLAYLTNEAWFAGLSFYVDERVHIPRSPIAELIEQSFEPWVEPEHLTTVLDLCTGSGSLAVAIGMHFEDVAVDAVDLSSDALAVAAINVERYHLEKVITLVQSDLFSKLKDKKYDLIVSNPPYVSANTYNSLPKEYHFEPHMALQSGQDGLDALRIILKEAANHLTPQGILVVEVGYLQAEVNEAFPQYPFTWIQLENGGEGVFVLTAEELREASEE